MVEPIYYNGTKLLSLSDINGNKPEIYICTSNRSAGKTTFFSRLLVNRFKKYGEKFCLVYRFNYELDECAQKFFKDINTLFFKGDTMTSIRQANGVFHTLLLNDVTCGYAVSINNADQIKKYSHYFSDVSSMMFDEFQSETNHYCSEEVRKFMSIHTSIARGQGEQVRRVPVYMISNPVSLINPYYVALNISSRIHEDTKFLRGDGFVLENGFNESACKAQEGSLFNRAFANESYTAYASQGVYLNDNLAFIERPKGKSYYLATLKYNGKFYALREYTEKGIIYCDTNGDETFPYKISVTTDDHNVNYVMLKRNSGFLTSIRFFFEHGNLRFKDLQCKECVLKCISY